MQRIVSFQLTMPNVGSWNGRWSGADSKYYIIKRISDRYLNSKEWFKDFLKNGKDSWHYSWNDGWGANVRAEIIDSTESRKRKKLSAGFCGYDWMVDSIMWYGKIQSTKERQNDGVLK